MFVDVLDGLVGVLMDVYERRFGVIDFFAEVSKYNPFVKGEIVHFDIHMIVPPCDL